MSEGGVPSARAPPAYLTAGGRQRFEVELRPGETTIVSWKKLVKDANRAAKEANKSANAKSPAREVPPVANPDLESRVAPGEPPEDDAKDAPPASRFSAVIEKIERLYMGKNSSDEEDLNDVPDDDEYDTEDSFIDDAELDEYFQVDNSAIKHDGFFVNRGKLERVNEPTTSSPLQQQKKRRRKDLAEGPGESNEGDAQNKHLKVRKKAAGRPLTLPEKDCAIPTLVMALPSANCKDMMVQNQSNSSEVIVKKKSANVKKALHQSPSRVTNGEAIAEEKGDVLKAGVLPDKNYGIKSKDGNEFSGTSNQILHKKSLGTGEDVGQSSQQGEMIKIGEKSSNIVSEVRNSTKAMKVPHVQRKEGSSSKSKTTMLEKAIRDLEKMVAESRPPSTEASDADNLNQTSKRRMPPEMKHKLAKIARLAHSAHGMISKELLNRLMSIVGHMIQLRTLKRNMKNLGDMGLSAKKEINSKIEQMKKDIDDMVKVHGPLMKTKAIEQPGGTSDDFQEIGTADKEVLKHKFSMDDAVEDKICDLYDLYIQGMEEDPGPQAHKLYAELAELWPKGCMDNHRIKLAICRAKDRKKAVHGLYKNQEKMKKKKLMLNKEETRQVETNSVTLSQYVEDKLVTEQGAASVDKSVYGVITTDATTKAPNAVVNGGNKDRPKQEKLKGNSNNMKITELLVKKKSKRKAESELGEALARSDKLNLEKGEERNKSVKQSAGSSPKTNLQSPPSSDNIQ
ncbi:HUN domain-containing protein [Heracleum sosnowskyi]|uniref:HUN domain-containing protein n=1 Tax=Heracleum sosnowskyi TaxID=360622 RepID=A0AAD8M5E0_9APIA|nr:HUN domain-containing protein [Heracleum sosnowskyi]